VRTVDSNDFHSLLQFASAKRKAGEFGLADLLFKRGVEVMRREERTSLSRLLEGGMSTAQADARVEWGRMLEDNVSGMMTPSVCD
jgi:hypothetical protein